MTAADDADNVFIANLISALGSKPADLKLERSGFRYVFHANLDRIADNLKALGLEEAGADPMRQLVAALNYAKQVSSAQRRFSESLELELTHTADVGESGKSARAAPRAALITILTFLSDIGVDDQLRAPLFRLLAALDDADLGLKRNEILNPVTHADREQLYLNVGMLQGATAVAAVEILIDVAGQKQSVATAYVAKQMRLDDKKLTNLRENMGKRPRGKLSGPERRAPREMVKLRDELIELQRSTLNVSPKGFVAEMLRKYRAFVAGRS